MEDHANLKAWVVESAKNAFAETTKHFKIPIEIAEAAMIAFEEGASISQKNIEPESIDELQSSAEVIAERMIRAGSATKKDMDTVEVNSYFKSELVRRLHPEHI